jgi:uncharacterized protein YndB with AHSA1/START domain
MSTAATLKVATPTDREIAMTRVVDAPRTAVFDALTKPELLQRWMSGPPGWSLAVCETDLRVGGAMRFVWRGPDGTEMGMRGVHREIVPPERLVHTELFDKDWTGGETQVTNRLAEQDGGKTALTMTILYASREARDAALRTGMEGGVAASYDNLAELLASASARAA